ncbi:MAG: YlxR family protein [Atribacterota bacterium]|nr:YlxR family protein [Candidatus Atribacteria bacterium]
MLKKKKVPLRLCLVCRERKEKKALVRIVKRDEGGIEFDPTGKKPGRGAYVCPNQECIEKLNRNILSAAFKTDMTDSDVSELKRMMRDLSKSLHKEVRDG